ncbi:uncharacterized protein LOC131687461 [Topomyia yanbarensis]|uniref:uncharacterized protein LOC131687461 n=1 Tax=Topomyia yanbarensis TaxID=2498891 RepID=UPI00273AB507|nr:uncharacterized protein LOC131687461 [Topomyia yanbarensis]
MTTTTSAAVIQKLERIFTRLGIPDILTTDNAANFCSQEFKDYCTDNGIKLAHTTPYWPAANGEVERQNRSILKALKINQLNGGVSPAELMFGRRFKDKFPHIGEFSIVKDEITDKDLATKHQAKLYRDKKFNAKVSDLQIGDQVLMKNQHKNNKLAPNFLPEPAVVIDRHGSNVTVQTEGGDIYHRNTSHLKPLSVNIGPDGTEQLAKTVQTPTALTDCFETTNTPGNHGTVQTPTALSDCFEATNTPGNHGSGMQKRPIRNAKVPVRFKIAPPCLNLGSFLDKYVDITEGVQFPQLRM